jgi:hypothetical protein
MFQRIINAIRPSKGTSLARALSRLGWAGFWLQIVVGSGPILVMAYYMAFSSTGSPPNARSGFPFIEYLTFANLLLLLFTIYWSYGYTRVARRIMDPERRPTESYVVGVVWTGVLASTVSMLFSMFVILIEAGNLLFLFLKAPQGGIPVIQTGSDSVYWVSSVDMVSLIALILTLFAEFIVLQFSLWLLFQATLGTPEFPHPEATEQKGQ